MGFWTDPVLCAWQTQIAQRGGPWFSGVVVGMGSMVTLVCRLRSFRPCYCQGTTEFCQSVSTRDIMDRLCAEKWEEMCCLKVGVGGQKPQSRAQPKSRQKLM